MLFFTALISWLDPSPEIKKARVPIGAAFWEGPCAGGADIGGTMRVRFVGGIIIPGGGIDDDSSAENFKVEEAVGIMGFDLFDGGIERTVARGNP